MKLTMLGILMVLLVAALAAPAAAATAPLASGSYIADVIRVSNDTVCGRVVISAIAPFSFVYSVDYHETSVTNCNTGVLVGPILAPTEFDLCRRDETNAQIYITTIRDTNANGKIDGLEGILKGPVGSGNTATIFELREANNSHNCNNTLHFRTGYHQP